MKHQMNKMKKAAEKIVIVIVMKKMLNKEKIVKIKLIRENLQI
jgi:hypothetical protein